MQSDGPSAIMRNDRRKVKQAWKEQSVDEIENDFNKSE